MSCSIVTYVSIKDKDDQYSVVVLRNHCVSDLLLRVGVKMNKTKIIGDVYCDDVVLEKDTNVFELAKQQKLFSLLLKEEEEVKEVSGSAMEDALQKQLLEARKKNEELKKEMEQKRKEYTNLENEFEVKSKQLEDLIEELADAQVEVQTVTSNSEKELEDVKKDFEVEIAELKSIHEEEVANLKKGAEEEVEDLKKDIEELKSNNNAQGNENTNSEEVTALKLEIEKLLSKEKEGDKKVDKDEDDQSFARKCQQVEDLMLSLQNQKQEQRKEEPKRQCSVCESSNRINSHFCDHCGAKAGKLSKEEIEIAKAEALRVEEAERIARGDGGSSSEAGKEKIRREREEEMKKMQADATEKKKMFEELSQKDTRTMTEAEKERLEEMKKMQADAGTKKKVFETAPSPRELTEEEKERKEEMKKMQADAGTKKKVFETAPSPRELTEEEKERKEEMKKMQADAAEKKKMFEDMSQKDTRTMTEEEKERLEEMRKMSSDASAKAARFESKVSSSEERELTEAEKERRAELASMAKGTVNKKGFFEDQMKGQNDRPLTEEELNRKNELAEMGSQTGNKKSFFEEKEKSEPLASSTDNVSRASNLEKIRERRANALAKKGVQGASPPPSLGSSAAEKLQNLRERSNTPPRIASPGSSTSDIAARIRERRNTEKDNKVEPKKTPITEQEVEAKEPSKLTMVAQAKNESGGSLPNAKPKSVSKLSASTSLSRGSQSEGLTLSAHSKAMNKSPKIAIAAVLANDPEYDILDLSGNTIFAMKHSQYSADLAAALKDNTHIREIHLKKVDLDKKDVAAIMDALRVNKTVLVVDFEKNKIDNEGAAALATAMRENSTIREVNLLGQAGRAFGDACLTGFIDMFDYNVTVTKIIWRLDSRKSFAINKLLVRNNTIKKNLEENRDVGNLIPANCNVPELLKVRNIPIGENEAGKIGEKKEEVSKGEEKVEEKGGENKGEEKVEEKVEDKKEDESKEEDKKESKVEDRKEDESKEEDKKEDESKVEDKKEDESKVEDKKEDESKVEDKKEDESKVEDKKEDESKVEDKKEDESKEEDRKEDESKEEDKKEDESKEEDKKEDESKEGENNDQSNSQNTSVPSISVDIQQCYSCKEDITDEILSWTDKSFHNKCFKCSICDKLFTDALVAKNLDDIPHCESCYNEVKKTESKGVLHIHKRSGSAEVPVRDRMSALSKSSHVPSLQLGPGRAPSDRLNSSENSLPQRSKSAREFYHNKSASSSPRSPRKTEGGFKSPRSSGKLSGTQALLKWAQKRTDEKYEGVDLGNWKQCWQDGLGLCALAHSFFPDDIRYSDLKIETREDKISNCALAFKVLDEKGGVYVLLDPEDLVDVTPEPRSLQTYISEIRKRLDPQPGDSPLPKRGPKLPRTSVSTGTKCEKCGCESNPQGYRECKKCGHSP